MEGQVPALVKEGEHYFLQVKAPEAENVTFTMNEEEFPCTGKMTESGVWSTLSGQEYSMCS